MPLTNEELIQYALLADQPYAELRVGRNRPVMPSEWNPLDHIGQNSNGFTADVFRKGNEIVISFAGTNSRALSDDGLVDWMNNLKAASGVALAPQLLDAAELYLRVKATPQNSGATISFTGHSLGGGIASLLAVIFEQKAVTFATAPFKNTLNVVVLGSLRSSLQTRGFSGDALAPLDALIADLSAGNQTVLNAREQAVEGHAINGEILGSFRSPMTVVMGQEHLIDVGSTELEQRL